MEIERRAKAELLAIDELNNLGTPMYEMMLDGLELEKEERRRLLELQAEAREVQEAQERGVRQHEPQCFPGHVADRQDP